MKVSNGISIAVVVTLSSSMLPILIGVLVGMQFKLTPTQTASIGIAIGISGIVAPLAALNAEGAGTRAFRKLHS